MNTSSFKRAGSNAYIKSGKGAQVLINFQVPNLLKVCNLIFELSFNNLRSKGVCHWRNYNIKVLAFVIDISHSLLIGSENCSFMQ